MKCLCCGKEIKANAKADEIQSRWHKKCVKNFFGTTTLPFIELTDEALKALTQKTVNQGLTVPGVQRKLSLHLETEQEARLTLVDYPTGYILKPHTADYANMPEFEQMAMLMSEEMGIQTVPHALIRVENKYAYITRRVDREISMKHTEMYAMEDFCQLSGRLTDDKYKGSYENCGKIVRDYSQYAGFDKSEFFRRVVGCFVMGNSDMHLKNFSLIEDQPGSRTYRLSPAYDMLPVNIIVPADREQMALTVNGKKRNIRRNDFLKLAENCQLSKEAAIKIIQKIISTEERLLEICEESLLPDEFKESTKQLIQERCEVLR